MGNNTHQQFLEAYDKFVNEIFLFFFTRTMERDAARILTQSTFKQTWRQIARGYDREDLGDLHELIHLNARRLARSTPARTHIVPA